MKEKITYLWILSILWIGFDSKGYAADFLDPLQKEFVSGTLTDFAKKTTENHKFAEKKVPPKKKEALEQESSD
jgi:hypothetical protein